jgi:type I restriction enzyme, S subunit
MSRRSSKAAAKGPNHWPEVTVAEVCSHIIDCVNKTAPAVTGPTPYKMIRTTNVRGGWVDVQNVKYVDEEVYRRWIRRGEPRPGDVILTREARLGEVGLLRSSEPIFLGQRLVMYRTDPAQLDNHFLLYSMIEDFVQNQIAALGSGATVEHMRVPDCERLRLRLPPLPTQQRIASVLSTYDRLIEKNRRRIQGHLQLHRTG